jgi:hypothetical protein
MDYVATGTGKRRAVRHATGFLFAAVLSALLWNVGPAHAATCTSNGAGASWNTAANWTCAPAPVNKVPVAADTVIVANNMTVDVSTAVLASLTVNTGVTLTQNATRTIQTGILNINGTGVLTSNAAVTATGATTIVGTLTSNSAITLAAVTLTGDLTLATAGAVNMNGLLTINSPGTFSNPANRAITFLGGVTNNNTTAGSFDAGTNTVTLNATQAFGGAGPIDFGGVVAVNAFTITNNNANLSIAGNLTGVAGSTWTNAANSVLNYGGALVPMGTRTFNTTGAPNTVNYNGIVAQSIRLPSNAAGYVNLTISNTSAAVSAATSFAVTGTMTVNAGAIVTPAAAVIISGAGTLTGAGEVQVTRTAATADFGSQYTIANKTLTNLNVEYTGTATQVITGGLAYGNLTIANTTAAGVTAPSNFTVSGFLTVNANATLIPAAATVISGTGGLTGSGTVRVTRVGTLTGDGAGQYALGGATLTNLTVVYQGAAAQFVDALAFGKLTINNTNGVTLVGDASVATLLTLTLGNVTTGASTLTNSSNCATTVRTSGHVIGNFEQHIPAGVSTCVFHVGTGANYTPVSVTFPAGTTAGDVTGATTAGDHAQIASSGLDSTQSINRVWTLTNSATNPVVLGGAGYSATFTWVAAADQDAGITTGVLRAMNYSGGAWNGATVTANAATSITIGSELDFGDFSVGEVGGYNSAVGRFNAYTVLAPGSTVQGFITTQVAGTLFNLTIIHMTGGVLSNINDATVTVALYDGTDSSGAFTNNCSATWVAIPGASQVINFPNVTTRTASFTINNSYPNVRVRISNTGSTQIGCSTDRFAIRPASLTVSASDATWSTAGTGRPLTTVTAAGAPVHKAGTSANPMPFTIRAIAEPSASVTNYAGTPTVKAGSPVCNSTLTPGCVNGTLSLGTFGAAAGTVTSNTANYSEVGAFTMDLEDQSFAAVDYADGTTAAQRTIPQTTAALAVGRFVPSHFVVSTANTPQYRTFSTGCSSTFTYIGQSFGWVTPPQAVIAAKNAAGATTANYKGVLWKVVASDVTEAYTSAPATLDSTGKGTLTVLSGGTGTGTSTSDSAGTFFYTRSTAQAPFNANITLTVSAQDATENGANQGIITSTTSGVFSGAPPGTGIDFDAGTEFRYGRFKIPNYYGSELLDLPIAVRAQYWNGTSYVDNTADSCTSIATGNFSQAYAAGGTMTTAVTGAGLLSGGTGTIKLAKPSSFTTKGSRDVTSGYTYLPGTGRQTFGVYKSGPVIYVREVH